MKKLALIGIAVLAMALVAGCGSKVKVWRPDGSPGYIDMQGKKFLVMPADMRYLPGDKLKLAAALFGGFIAEFGENGISLQPIQPMLEKVGLGDLSWKLARGLVHAAFFHHSSQWDSCGGEDYSVVPNLVKTLVEKVAELLGKPDLKFDYIVVLHIDSRGAGTIPGTLKLRVIGGVYDPMKDEILVAVDWDQVTAEDALLAEMATIGPKAVGLMMGKSPEKKEAAAEGTAEGTTEGTAEGTTEGTAEGTTEGTTEGGAAAAE
jgi:hypothetical protein